MQGDNHGEATGPHSMGAQPHDCTHLTLSVSPGTPPRSRSQLRAEGGSGGPVEAWDRRSRTCSREGAAAEGGLLVR